MYYDGTILYRKETEKCSGTCLNSEQNIKNLDLTTLEGFADNNLSVFNVAKRIIYLIDRVENIVRKGKNAGLFKVRIGTVLVTLYLQLENP